MTSREEYEEYAGRDDLEMATFAGGCFWCMVPPFEETEGVEAIFSGYTGGDTANPSYKEVSSGTTGHVEAVQLFFDPDKVSYEELLDTFWRHIDPTDDVGQFNDRGDQYKTAVFCHDKEQRKLAEKSKEEMDESGIFQDPIVTEIRNYEEFYPAEEYHQDYHQKNPLRYKMYKKLSGRDRYLKKAWKEE